VGDLAQLGEPALVIALGKSAGRHLHQLALGIDDRPVVVNRDPRSVGHEETFASDRHGRAELQTDVVRLADSVASRLRQSGLCARTVTIKVRFSDFTTITRSLTGADPIDDALTLIRTAGELLDQIELASGVRLLGVSGSNLVSGGRQLSFDDAAAAAGYAGTSAVVDEIRERFGTEAIAPASLVDSTGLTVHRRGMQQWGPGSSSFSNVSPMETRTPRVVADDDV
jgi:DNA polymerase-4